MAMRDELLDFYERELAYLRRTGADFAKQYPKVAGRLLLEPTKCDDPHVERLLEGFAFLAARVHLRMHDDFPEFSEGLLDVVYPQFTRPIPSMSLVEFELDPAQGKLTTGYSIPRGTQLYSRPVAGHACRFQTCYDTTLWPIRIESAKWLSPHELSPPVREQEAVAALRIELRCAPEITFASLELNSLRLHLRADSALAATLYEVLCNNTLRVIAREPGGRGDAAALPASAVRPVGFDADEGILPVPRRAFVGYRLLQEYFTFADKFFFVDIEDFARVRTACPGDRAELIFLISAFERPDRRAMLETGVAADTIRLGCTPIVNLFPQASEPVLIHQRRNEYVIVPDARRRATTSIYSVESVSATSPGSEDVLHLEPFHSFRHGLDPSKPTAYWTARRRPAGWREDRATDVYLSFVDLSSRPVYPDADVATARLLCFNGDLPARLPFGDRRGDFEMPGGGPIRRIVSLVKPTDPVYPQLGRPQLWRLISQLSLNYMSLAEGGADTLRELLRLHNFADSPAAERQIAGIMSVRGESTHAGIESEQGVTFARGQRVEIEFDEEQFAGGGVYLMASVLERFLGLYVSLNSFSILTARTKQRKERLREWPPRSGWKALL
jgi:type VI secretion system protein ImpG